MNLQSAILATLAYHDIFDYPLDSSEIGDLLVKKKARKESIARVLERLMVMGKVGQNERYFFLKNRKKIARIRKQRSKYSQAKLKRAAFFAGLLKIIPSVKLVAVSGALSMENSRRSDDIDLVVVTSKGLLWTTRFLANIILLPFKRDPAGQKISDRACLNMFLDESDLSIKDHNMYTAHEICQMRIFWDRDNTYRRFLKANSWIREYLPNWQPNRVTSAKSQVPSHKSNKFITHHLALITERILCSFQLSYMKSKITTERISKTQLFFHPKNTQEKVLKLYNQKVKRFSRTGLDKVFNIGA